MEEQGLDFSIDWCRNWCAIADVESRKDLIDIEHLSDCIVGGEFDIFQIQYKNIINIKIDEETFCKMRKDIGIELIE